MRMSRVAMLGVAGIAMAMPASAEQVNLTATVLGSCQFVAAPTIPSSTNISVGSLSPTASVLTIPQPTGPGGIMQFWKFTLQVNGTCNKVSELKLSSQGGGLKDPNQLGAPAPGFVNRFDYFASAGFDGAGPVSFPTTNGAPVSSTPTPEFTTAPFSGLATVFVTGVPNTSGPVMAGNYSDTLVLSLIPQ